MTRTGLEVLVVDDDAEASRFLSDALRAEGFHTRWTSDPREALRMATDPAVGAVVTDLNMPDIPGLEVCRSLMRDAPTVPVVVVTAFGSVESAVAAMKAGAYDFVTKPFDVMSVSLTIERALQHCAMRRELLHLRARADGATAFGRLLGDSDAMQEVYSLVERLSASDASVLVTGESGTGKELVAQELHRRGPRARGRFVAINCAAMPEPLLESELFGHVRGAFTDARADKDGLFVQADGGTLFLDEIGDMPSSLQPKLLRVLQEGTVRPVGSSRELPLNVRVVAATNRDLEVAIEERTFREDLYYRINVVQIALPPLRTRGRDVLQLADSLLTELAARAERPVLRFSAAAAEKLLAYDWPGNVRELRNCVERAVALAQGDTIDVAELPPRVRDREPRKALLVQGGSEDIVPLEEVERRYILRVVEMCGGNKSVAARLLGLNRKTLYRKLEAYSSGSSAAADVEADG